MEFKVPDPKNNGYFQWTSAMTQENLKAGTLSVGQQIHDFCH